MPGSDFNQWRKSFLAEVKNPTFLLEELKSETTFSHVLEKLLYLLEHQQSASTDASNTNSHQVVAQYISDIPAYKKTKLVFAIEQKLESLNKILTTLQASANAHTEDESLPDNSNLTTQDFGALRDFVTKLAINNKIQLTKKILDLINQGKES